MRQCQLMVLPFIVLIAIEHDVASPMLVTSNFGNDIHVVLKKMQRNSVRNLMCVGRYAEKM